jgi:formate dehydrogenase assembly factor FdhD
VDLARATGLLLVGFLRGDAMTVYSAPERVPV